MTDLTSISDSDGPPAADPGGPVRGAAAPDAAPPGDPPPGPLELRLILPAKNVRVVNPLGTVAICTLWTPVDHMARALSSRNPGLLDPRGPVALLGGLYGGGLSVMLRNLHFNPQIDAVVVCGKDFSGGGAHLGNFLAGRVEPTGDTQAYVFDDGRSEVLEKISVPGPDSAYVMDGLLLPGDFKRPVRVVGLAGLGGDELAGRLAVFLAEYRPQGPPPGRPEAVPLPRPLVRTFPSDVFGHAVSARTIPEAWLDLMSALSRFGRPVRFRSGKERLELLGVKAVVERPCDLDPAELEAVNLSAPALADYKRVLLDGAVPEGLPYSYGNRLRRHFGRDLLAEMARDLSLAGDSRHAWASLWDNRIDPPGRDSPCLASVFFRKVGGLVHLAAVFRSHNGARAWPVNCVGLAGLMEFVCREANSAPGRTEPEELSPGTLSVTSMSISLDPADLPQVGALIERRDSRPPRMAEDPNGYFRISNDLAAKEMVVHHHAPGGELLAEYRAASPRELTWRLQRAKAVSDIGHAMYLGAQLERAWYCLRRGREYVQDKTALAD